MPASLVKGDAQRKPSPPREGQAETRHSPRTNIGPSAPQPLSQVEPQSRFSRDSGLPLRIPDLNLAASQLAGEERHRSRPLHEPTEHLNPRPTPQVRRSKRTGGLDTSGTLPEPEVEGVVEGVGLKNQKSAAKAGGQGRSRGGGP